jgi:hypothetical protein
VSNGEHVGDLVAGCFDSSVLDLASNLRIEVSLGHLCFAEVRVVAGIALDANAPTLLGHSEHESPSLLGVEVGIGKHQKTLVGL